MLSPVFLLFALLPLAMAESVAMRDGTNLETDVFFPEGEGPFSVILRRTPYGRAMELDSIHGITGMGWALVSQDVRGRGDSEGEFRPFFDDALDGVDTVEWVAAQPWCNGKIAFYGGSAESVVQVLAAGEGPPSLSGIMPMMGSGDLRYSFYPGGAWREELNTAWLESLEEDDLFLRENEVDGPVWDAVRLDDEEYARVTMPALMIGGVYDIFENEMVDLIGRIQAASDNRDVFLVLGPWSHGDLSSPVGQLNIIGADYDLNSDLLAFYQHVLDGAEQPDWAPVRFFLLEFADSGFWAGGEWREAETWPPPSTSERLFLSTEGLTADPGGEASSIDVDPEDPVPSFGGGNLTTDAGPYNQALVDSRDDVAVWSSLPRKEAVELIGDVSATLYASSATTDVDLVARLEVQTPGGWCWLVADGIRRGRFVQGEQEIIPLEPGVPARFEIDLGPVSLSLPPGHTLRLALSGSLYPRYERNPNEAVPMMERPIPVPTTLTLYQDEAHPSFIDLPVYSGSLGGRRDPGETADTGTSGITPKGEGCGCASTVPRGSLAGILLSLLLYSASRSRGAIHRAPPEQTRRGAIHRARLTVSG